MKVLLSSDEIQARILEMGRQITADYAGREPHLVGVLKGACPFMTDLAQAIDLPLTLDFIAVSSYGAATKSSGEVKLVKDLDQGLEGRDLLVVEDIVDTGLTLNYLRGLLRARGPRTLKVVALLSKPSRRLVERRGRLRGLHDRRPLRGGLRPRLQRAVPEPPGHQGLRRLTAAFAARARRTWPARRAAIGAAVRAENREAARDDRGLRPRRRSRPGGEPLRRARLGRPRRPPGGRGPRAWPRKA